MGKLLGVHESDDELDRPDLNKCPECGCYFKQDACPLCGMVCPEEMRAGNRKTVKKKKHRRGSGAGRVTFLAWYHEWWVIIPMLIFMPVIGIILLLSSPHRRSLKIGIVAAAAAYTIFVSYGLGAVLIDQLFHSEQSPVNTSMSREEYIAACDEVSPEDFYRSPSSYEKQFVKLTLIVDHGFTDWDAYYEDSSYPQFYVCKGNENATYRILIRDCAQDVSMNLISGDVITVYGEGAGDVMVYDMNLNVESGPCLNVAYLEMANE